MGIIANQSIKGALANYLGVVIGAVTTFFVVTDLLKPEEVGLTRVLVDAAMLFAGLAQLGTNSSIVRFYPYFKDEATRDHGFFGWTLLVPLVGFGVLAVLLLLLKDTVVGYYAQNSPMVVDYAYVLLPLTLFVLYMQVFESNASALMSIAVPKFVREVVVRVLNLTAYLLYGHRVIGLDVFVWMFCASYAVAAVVDLVYLTTLGKISLRIEWRFVKGPLVREVVLYTVLMTAGVLAGNVKLFNSIFLAREGLVLAGIYTIASYIANVIEIPYRSLGAISNPVISASMREGNLKEVQRLGRQVATHQLLVASMLLFFIWINLGPLFGVIPNGAEYASGMGVVLFLGLANVMNSTLSTATSMLNYSRFYALSLPLTVLLTAAAIMLNGWLIPRWGAMGSACATLGAYVVYFVPLLAFLRMRLGVSLFERKQLFIVLLTAVLFGLNALWERTVSPLWGDGVAAMLAQALVRTAVFAAVAYAAIRRMHISADVDRILRLRLKKAEH